MDPESKKLLEDTLLLTQENNKMLKKVRNVQKWTVFWSGVKAFVIVGLAVGAFYYMEPYLDSLVNIYGSLSGVEETFTGGGGFQQFMEIFKNN